MLVVKPQTREAYERVMHYRRSHAAEN